MEKIKSRWSLGWIMELLRLEKAPRSSSPTFNQILPWLQNHQGPHVLSSWMVTLPPPWGAFSKAWPLFPWKVFPNIQDNSTSLLPNKFCHPCHGLERKRSSAGTVDWGWEKLRAKTHKISALSLWRMECVGLRPFPRCPQGAPKGPEEPQQLRIGIWQWDISEH